MTDTNLSTVTPGDKLVLYARNLAVQIAERPEVASGMAAAESARGLVVTDAAADVAANDLGATIARTQKAIKAAADEVKRHPKDMIAAIDEIVKPLLDQLAAGRKAVDDAQVRYKAEQQRIAAAAEAARVAAQREAERLELERAAQAAEQRAAAALEGREPEPEEEEIPPAAVAAPIEAPRALVSTSAGRSTMTKRLTCELVDVAECNPYWLSLTNTKGPIADFEGALAHGDVAEPGIGVENGVRHRGCVFFYNATMSRSAR